MPTCPRLLWLCSEMSVLQVMALRDAEAISADSGAEDLESSVEYSVLDDIDGEVDFEQSLIDGNYSIIEQYYAEPRYHFSTHGKSSAAVLEQNTYVIFVFAVCVRMYPSSTVSLSANTLASSFIRRWSLQAAAFSTVELLVHKRAASSKFPWSSCRADTLSRKRQWLVVA
jgi:hypothetical protein